MPAQCWILISEYVLRGARYVATAVISGPSMHHALLSTCSVTIQFGRHAK